MENLENICSEIKELFENIDKVKATVDLYDVMVNQKILSAE